MERTRTRREYLTVAGLATLGGITGCLGTAPEPATDRWTDDPAPTTASSTPVDTATPTYHGEDPREYRGELLHPADDWSGWTATEGRITATSETAFLGTASLRLNDVDRSGIRCVYDAGDDPLDLRSTALCGAIRWDLPDASVAFFAVLVDGQGVRVTAPANAIPAPEHTDDDWVMTEFGIAAEIDDEPIDLSDIRELKLVFNNGVSEHTRVYVDNLRLIPYERRRGAVLFTADDGRRSQLHVMRPVLAEYGYESTHFNMRTATGGSSHMSAEEQRTLAAEDGCFVCPHPQHSRPLPQMSDAESYEALKREYEFFASEDGLGLGHRHARYMSWPYGQSDTGTIDQAREFYDVGFDGTGGATAGWRSAAPMSIARASFDSLEELLSSLAIAERYGRVLIPQFHVFREDEPTGGTNMKPSDFRSFVEAVDSRDVDVVSVEEFYETHEPA
jgi:peptidoglycan/xylan/chitin deacetylase (PgdA/CDA1 family)